LECGNTTIDEAPLLQVSPDGTPGTYVQQPGYGVGLFRDDVWLGEDNVQGPNHDGIFKGQPTGIGDSIPWLDMEVLSTAYRPTNPHKSRLMIGVSADERARLLAKPKSRLLPPRYPR
jgi:hypothetical protein